MDAELLAIGSELTSGHTLNTNAAYLARQLARLGLVCRRHTSVPDNAAAIGEAVTEALERAAVFIATGGLGPTFDDITMAAVARATGRPLRRHAEVERRIRAFCRAHKRPATALALRQAALPAGGEALPNPVGTAPGLWLPLGRKLLIALPGVPQEMRAIMERSVLPRLRRHQRAPVLSRTIRTIGLVELDVQAALQRLRIPEVVQLGLYPHLRAVDVRLTIAGSPASTAAPLLNRLERAIRRALGPAVYGVDDQTMEGVIGQALVRRHRTLAVAESCTGGLIADRLTNVPGSSRYLLAAVVAYHNRTKQELLGVRAAELLRHGSVSEPVARAMAQGVRRRTEADIGLAVTGIAGPTGGTRAKPVGLVYVALADRRRAEVQRFQFQGDRLSVKYQTSQMALESLRRWLS